MDTRLYVCTHKKFISPDDDVYIPLNVGSVLREDLGYIRDDSGDEISAKNPHYCELTGVYWIWKNVRCDITGICHYRRYFIEDEAFVRRERIEELLDKYDIILPCSEFTKYGSVREHYEGFHYKRDLDCLRQVILEKYPEYIPDFDFCMDINLLSIGNMMICQKSLFDEYCEWLFDILFEVERRSDLSEYDTLQARLYGYLSERMLRIWVMHKALSVYELEVRMIDPGESENMSKKVELTSNMVDLYLKDVITLYKNGHMQNLVTHWPVGPDMKGKIPVFLCWWQGFENAPDVVKLCRASVDRHFMNDRFEIHEITFANLNDYVYFPEHIAKLFNDGIIGMPQIFDVVRVMLLYRYGGLWVDPTYFVAVLPGADTFAGSFFTIKSGSPVWRTDIADGRWTYDLMYAKPGNKLMEFLINAVCYYYFQTREAVDDNLFDYLIDLAYRTFADVREMVDNVPYTAPLVGKLQDKMNKRFSGIAYQSMISDTSFFKLANKEEYRREIVTGERTFYGHLLEEYGL